MVRVVTRLNKKVVDRQPAAELREYKAVGESSALGAKEDNPGKLWLSGGEVPQRLKPC